MKLASSSMVTNNIIVLLICALSSLCVSSWRLDCTRFVFAPRCRGVAAKRSQYNDGMSVEDNVRYDNPPSEESFMWKQPVFPFTSYHVKYPGPRDLSRKELQSSDMKRSESTESNTQARLMNKYLKKYLKSAESRDTTRGEKITGLQSKSSSNLKGYSEEEKSRIKAYLRALLLALETIDDSSSSEENRKTPYPLII